MLRYLLILLALFALPAPLHAQPAQENATDTAGQVMEENGGQDVEEPDAIDNSEETPKNEMSPAQEKAQEKAEEKAIEKAPPEKTPGQGMEAGSNAVILQGLNKVSAKASKIEAIIGIPIRFGTLEIIAHSCWKSAPGDQPENAALLEINEIKQGEPPARIFLGWMFSSSPSISSLEHPFYDITVIKCDKVDNSKL